MNIDKIVIKILSSTVITAYFQKLLRTDKKLI